MNFQNTQVLTDDTQKETNQSLNNSELSDVSQNDDISEDNYHELQSNIDLHKTELHDANGEKGVEDCAEVILPKKKELKSCGWYNGDYICTNP
ncbi:MAG: hypothetical protein RMX35_24350 [Nostoc sp. DcaGUA01]|uniref:hypothetical protein n=1 Tax=Nostoc sp. CCY 9925 TaxID=3103865 RepID=UPI002ADA0A61|nr:hypothetical protein [Nostoc sp. DcaGUA01]